jgi:putative oxidoreductase
MEITDIGLAVLRCWAGVVMLAHGINHARNQEGTATWFAKVGYKSPELNARLSSLTEIAVGLGLLAGLLTTVAAAGLASIMAVAFWSIHRFSGFFVFNRPTEGYEYVTTMAVVALVIAIFGPGGISLDAVVGTDLDGLVGAGIFGLGIVAAAGQLAMFWRRPVKENE